MFTKREQKDLEKLKKLGRATKHKQSDTPFKFLVRPFTTVGVEIGSLAQRFEDEVFTEISNEALK